MTTTSFNSNNKLLLFENVVNHAVKLCEPNAETRDLLQALCDVRFHGADPVEAGARLHDNAAFAFGLLSERIVLSMESYHNLCEQNRRNVSRSKKEAEEPLSSSLSPNVVGGGMALHNDSLRLLIRIAGADSDIGQYLGALYKIQYEDADPDSVEASLTGRPEMLFIMSRDEILANKEKYERRCEQNRQNASRRRRKSASPSDDASAPMVVAYTPDAPAQVVDSVPKLEVPALSTPDEAIAADQTQAQLDAATANPIETVGNEAVADGSTPSQTVGNGRSRSVTVAGNTKTNSNYKSNNTPPLTPPVADNKECENHSELQEQFDRLFALYPKKEAKSRAWKTYARINPDAELAEQIIAGLQKAMQIDYRFRPAGLKPQLYNWLSNEEWRDENMQLAHNYPQGQYDSRCDQTYNSYDQRSPMTESEMEERNARNLELLRARYGTI